MQTMSSMLMLSKVPKFLQALYAMLQDEDQRIMRWCHDGTYFQVFDIPRLEREVLPKYFKHSKLSSFQRQLNNFGFHKWTKTRANVCTFSHDVLVQCDMCSLSDLVERYHASRALAAAAVAAEANENANASVVSSPPIRALKRQRSHESSPAYCDANSVKRIDMGRVALYCVADADSAALDSPTSSSDFHTVNPWVFGSIDVMDARALDWDAEACDSLVVADLLPLLEPLTSEQQVCEPIDWELAADCLALTDSNLVAVAASVCSSDCIQTSG